MSRRDVFVCRGAFLYGEELFLYGGELFLELGDLFCMERSFFVWRGAYFIEGTFLFCIKGTFFLYTGAYLSYRSMSCIQSHIHHPGTRNTKCVMYPRNIIYPVKRIRFSSEGVSLMAQWSKSISMTVWSISKGYILFSEAIYYI